MATIIDKKLYLLKRERPEWWKPDEYVQIVFSKENMLFIWHRKCFKDGYLRIDNNYSIELALNSNKWFIKEHSPDCICLLNNAGNIALRKFDKYKGKIDEDEEFILSRDLRDVANMKKDDYSYSYRELIARFLNKEIGAKEFKEAVTALGYVIENWDLFEVEENKNQINSIENLKNMLLKKAQDPQANIIDIVRTIKSLDEDGGFKKERQLDDIIIDTEEENLEEFEIEIEE